MVHRFELGFIGGTIRILRNLPTSLVYLPGLKLITTSMPMVASALILPWVESHPVREMPRKATLTPIRRPTRSIVKLRYGQRIRLRVWSMTTLMVVWLDTLVQFSLPKLRLDESSTKACVRTIQGVHFGGKLP